MYVLLIIPTTINSDQSDTVTTATRPLVFYCIYLFIYSSTTDRFVFYFYFYFKVLACSCVQLQELKRRLRPVK